MSILKIMSEYRFTTLFKDGQRVRHFQLPQPITKYGDIEYVKVWLEDIRKTYPKLAKYIVETSRLIVEAAESDTTDANSA